jgi:sugar phosphate isomerase/epimerase
MFKLAFSTLGCPGWDLPQIIKAAVDFGYDGVELRGIKGEFDLLKTPWFASPAQTKKTVKLFEEKNLEIPCLSTSIQLAQKDERKQEENFLEAEEYLYLAVETSTKYIRVFGGKCPAGENPTDYLPLIVPSLKKIGELAEKLKKEVLLETHDDWINFPVVKKIIEKVNLKSVGILWDVRHTYRQGESFQETLENLFPFIKFIHIKDEDEKGYTFLGQGNIPYQQLLKELQRWNYQGYLSFEWEKVWQKNLKEPEEVFPQYVQQMRKYLKQIF